MFAEEIVSRVPSMPVIVAEVDPLLRRFITQSLDGTEFEPRHAEGDSQALESAKAPLVFLYGWGLPDPGGAEIAARLRQLRAPRERYTIAMLGHGEHQALGAALEAGADDVLVKPFSAELLLLRLRLAARRCASADRLVGTLHEALREALASEFGGEVVLRLGDRVGRIHVADGGIAWVNLAGEPMHLGSLVRSAGVDIDEEAAAAVLEESRRLGLHFADVLVKWGYVDEAGARRCVRAIVAKQLGALLEMPEATALFLPRARAYGSRMSFALSEVTAPSAAPRTSFEGAPAVSERQPLGLTALLEGYAEAAMKLHGARGAAVLDRSSGLARVCTGEGIEGELCWSLLGTLAALGPRAVDAIAVRSGATVLARAIDEASALVVAFSLDQTTLGLARATVKQLVDLRDGGAASLRGESLWGAKEGTHG